MNNYRHKVQPALFMTSNQLSNKPLSLTAHWLLLAAFLLIGLIITGMVVLVANGWSELMDKGTVVLSSALQNLLAFIFPAVVVAYIARLSSPQRVSAQLRLHGPQSLGKWLAIVAVVYVVALPALNTIVMWNEGMHLPSWLSTVEKSMREAEDSAQAMTGKLLDTKSVAEMLLMVLVVGVLTAMGEELFFRSALLGSALDRKRRPHLWVWVVAFIFSAFHLQFYGFIPRLLLGAWFGYLLLWSKSVWVPIFAHALNNSMVVIMSYLTANDYIARNYLDEVGVTHAGQMPWLAILSAVATIAIIGAVAHHCRKTNVISTPPPMPHEN